MPILVLVYFYVESKSRVLALSCLLLNIVWWSLVYFQASKGMDIALIVAAITVFLVDRRVGLKFLKIYILTALVCLCGAYLVAHTAFSTVSILNIRHETPFKMSSLSLRLVVYKHSLNLIIQHPWFGVGLLHYAAYLIKLAAYPHNSFLLIVTEWGLPAAVLVILLVVWAQVAWVKKYNYRAIERYSLNKQLVIRLP